MLNWMLDGRVLGQADTLLWPLMPGNHLLLLTGPDNKVYDQVSFQVRGRRERALSAILALLKCVRS
jgi:hypothetical protein